MLGIVYFLARQNGPQVGCSGDAWELRDEPKSQQIEYRAGLKDEGDADDFPS
jgi:hypothetical protein